MNVIGEKQKIKKSPIQWEINFHFLPIPIKYDQKKNNLLKN